MVRLAGKLLSWGKKKDFLIINLEIIIVIFVLKKLAI